MPTPEARAERRKRVSEMLERALGPRWRFLTAEALGRDPAAIRRVFTPPQGREDAPSTELEALAEFLVSVPEASWPARWQFAKN
ncbi:hypothetical protein [Celeribacter sp.]|uniref:hypothetical protein n=1 Tax=Celeribacter sp. TaxID=1890673 RepID=UPI003A8C9D41